MGGSARLGAALVATAVMLVGAAAPPQVPTAVVAVPGSNEVTVRWSPPAGGDPVVDYLVQKSVDAGATWSTVVGSPVLAPRTSLVAKRLANRKPIVFRVAARNTSGTSGWVMTATVVPREQPPQRVTALKGTSPRAGTITLTWRPPSRGPAPTRYDYRYRKGFGTFTAWKPLPVAARSVTFGGLVRGAQYLCQVRAVRVTDIGPTATVWVKVR